KIEIKFSMDDYPMGSIYATDTFPGIKISIQGTRRIQRVDLIKNGGILKSWEVNKENATFQMIDETTPSKPDNYYYVSVSGEFVVGLGLALLVKGKFKGVIRTMVIIPMLVAPIAVGIIWRLMYDPVFGIINQILAKIGIQGKNWLADPQIALWSVIIVEIWQWTPFIFLILLAGLESLPKECYEGAKIDGASSWQTFVYFAHELSL
ncbi:unnamed protein product, partial [marine sediment metagenome]